MISVIIYQPAAGVVWGLDPYCGLQSTPLDCACRDCSADTRYFVSEAGDQGTFQSRWYTVANPVRPCEHETSAFLFEQNAVQTMAIATVPRFALCA